MNLNGRHILYSLHGIIAEMAGFGLQFTVDDFDRFYYENMIYLAHFADKLLIRFSHNELDHSGGGLTQRTFDLCNYSSGVSQSERVRLQSIKL